VAAMTRTLLTSPDPDRDDLPPRAEQVEGATRPLPLHYIPKFADPRRRLGIFIDQSHAVHMASM
jgi:hypothetical protein